MSREFAKTNLSIWQDDDWRELPPPAQHLYQVLSTHPELSYCGVADWRPGRLVSLSKGWTVDDIQTIADCLEARHFIVRDDVSEEVLVRSWIRFDGLIKQPRLSVSMANAFAAVASNEIRGVIVHELLKLRDIEPDAPGWAKKQVTDILGLRSVDPKAREVPCDPFGQGFAYRFGYGFGEHLGQTQGNVSPLVSVPPTTATATATFQQQHANEPHRASDDAPDRFDEFWSAYPKRDGANPKKPAHTKWKTIVKKVSPDVLIDAAKAYAKQNAGKDPKFVAQAITWLNQERWNDDFTTTEPSNVHELPVSYDDIPGPEDPESLPWA